MHSLTAWVEQSKDACELFAYIENLDGVGFRQMKDAGAEYKISADNINDLAKRRIVNFVALRPSANVILDWS